jgi:hypothetical protein
MLVMLPQTFQAHSYMIVFNILHSKHVNAKMHRTTDSQQQKHHTTNKNRQMKQTQNKLKDKQQRYTRYVACICFNNFIIQEENAFENISIPIFHHV